MDFLPSEVILVPFPYRDRLAERARPAVVVSSEDYNRRGDLIVAALTSHAPRVPTAWGIAEWQAAGLQSPSTVRMLLATIATSRVLHRAGRLLDRDWAEVQARLRLALALC